MPKFNDLTNQVFGVWKAIKYKGNQSWLCRCTECSIEKTIRTYNLTKRTPKCDCQLVVPLGTTIDDLTVISVEGTQDYTCKCITCGKITHLKKYDLTHRRNTVCSHFKKRDLKGMTFGEWEVLEHSHDRMWLCKCSCGTIKEIQDYTLISGKSKSCGHPKREGFEVKVGETINSWYIAEDLGYGQYRCICECGTEKIVNVSNLRYGYSKSCGCKSGQNRSKTMLERYGDITSNRIENAREKWQIDTLNNKECLENFISKIASAIGRKPTASELADRLGIQKPALFKVIHKYNMEEQLSYLLNSSGYERQIENIIRSSYNGEIRIKDRKELSGYELDIYIPDKRVAIEFNGDYWHSSIFKYENYHRDKSIACIKRDIQLIHIFEYEWNDPVKRDKITELIKYHLGNNKLIYARNTEVQPIANSEAIEFCDKYHLQNGINSSFNLGMFYKSKLIGVMTFGGIRYTEYSDDTVEMYRLAFKSDISVIGGTQKLFKHFITTNPNINKIISYCDIAKFSGNTYFKLGFTTTAANLSRPNYVWVKNGKVLSRYMVTKKKLIELGYEAFGETENEIMSNLGYLKIHDSGNLRFVWNRGK